MLDVIEAPSIPFGPIGPTEWMEHAACAGDSDLFFAPFAERPEARVRREARARVICSRCPVADACQEYARTNRELGFWGGESEAERADAGYPPTTPIIGRKRVAEERARDAMRRAG
jgi:WhiB family redox-sensing transcriptional regulator